MTVAVRIVSATDPSGSSVWCADDRHQPLERLEAVPIRL
ncbi:hypothetical protein FB558_4114 [Pseudonocardia kunmingensis]|uniref:Uncharacterized protein n=1 Tax=Pseudonocardia kunmingensis TaxID=630975 RepID=A0A543DQG5_9PSEU|nr:hypothetical protein FB558_4114 [Pseudonocardia kunmingensis]